MKYLPVAIRLAASAYICYECWMVAWPIGVFAALSLFTFECGALVLKEIMRRMGRHGTIMWHQRGDDE